MKELGFLSKYVSNRRVNMFYFSDALCLSASAYKNKHWFLHLSQRAIFLREEFAPSVVRPISLIFTLSQ